MASKKISGITIQLGADATPIQKALKGIESTSKGLNSELGQVNRLLKFDPGNTTLLAQKQKILADSIENTGTKLDALKQAQGEVERMFKSGDIGEKEYREFQRQIEETEQSLKGYQTQMGRMREEQDKFQAGTKQLNTFLEATGKSLDDFQDVLGTKLTNSLKNGTANSDDLTVALNKMGKEALGADTDLKEMRESLNKIDSGGSIDEVSHDLQGMKVNSDEADGSLKELGNGVKTGALMMAGEIIADVGEKLIDLSNNAKEAFKEVDDGSDAVITATGATGELAEELDIVYKKLASTLPIDDFESIGQAVGEVNTQFGFVGDKLESATSLVLKFSEITGSDVVGSTQNAKQAISAFGLSGEDLGYVLDSTAKTAQDTGASVDSLFDNIISGAPQLKEMGLSFSESAELLGNFEQAGVDGSAALSSLSKASVTYAKDGKTLSEGLAETQDKILGAANQTDALTAAAEVFGTKGAVRMVDAIQRGTLNLADFGKEAEDSQGTVTTTFGNTLDAIDEETIASNNLKMAMADLGDSISVALKPVLEALVPVVQKIADWFGGLSDKTKTAIVVIGGIAAGIGTAISVLAALGVVFGPLIASITEAGGVLAVLQSGFSAFVGVLTGPIGIIIALSAAFVLAYTKIEPFRDFINSLLDTIKDFAENVYNTYIGPALEAVKGAFSNALSAITGFWSDYGQQIIDAASNLFAVLSPIIFAALGIIQGLFSGVFGTIINIVQVAWGGIKGIFENAFKVITGIFKVFAGIFTGDSETLVSGVKDIFGGLWGFLENGFRTLKSVLGTIVSGIANTIVGPIGGAVNGVINGVNWILDKVGSSKQFALWEVPQFAGGTGGLRKDTVGIVNDQKGSTYKEMIVPPHGQPFIPEGRDVVLPMEKGTKIMPARDTKSFLESLPKFAGGIGEFFSGAWETVKNFTGTIWDYISHPGKILQIAVDKFTDLAGVAEPVLSIAKGAVSTVFDNVKDFIKGIFDEQGNVNYNPSAGTEQWRTLATRALKMEGQYNEGNLTRLLYQMQTESGGNPNAINNWDINAQNGIPSKGLMQVIDPTFRAYARPGFDSNIYDPLSNMLASIRYALANYGSLAAAYRGTGYEKGIGSINLSDLIPSLPMLDVKWFKDGGILTKPAFFQMGKNRIGGAGEDGPEAITPVSKLKELFQEAALEVFGDKNIDITLNITMNTDGREIAKATVPYTQPLITERETRMNRLRGVTT